MIVHVTKTHRIRTMCGIRGMCDTFACVNCSVADRGSADKCSKMALFKQSLIFLKKTPMDFYEKSREDEASALWCRSKLDLYCGQVKL